MTAVQTAADLERSRLREVNGYREAIQKTDDSLTLKPVEPLTAAAYKKALHEWDLYALSDEFGNNHALTRGQFRRRLHYAVPRVHPESLPGEDGERFPPLSREGEQRSNQQGR
jgi:hypothetical protein